MKHNFLKLTAFLLIISLFLTGCGYGNTTLNNDDDNAGQDSNDDVIDGYTSITSMDGVITNPVDDVFTLCWLEDDSLNPFDNLSGENSAISSLMYEGLFTVSPDFTAEPCICTDYTVNDLTYTFNINREITFNDGSKVAAGDVAYSINQAMNSERYSSRLNCISSVSVEDADTLIVTVKRPNYTLPSLLDIPIIKRWTVYDTAPIGTGPYIFVPGSSSTKPYLKAYEGYRESLPIQEIHLYDISEIRPTYAMSQRKVDFILHNPLAGSLDVCIDSTANYYDTSILQYVGFDTNDPILGISEIRRAISHLVNRELIVSEVMGAGSVLSAPLVLSPHAPGYMDMSKSLSEYSTQVFSSVLVEMGAVDSDGDGLLELNGSALSFTFIVCDSDDYKVKAAETIASSMSSMGIKIDLKILSHDNYIQALDAGNFDMYYAEVRLPANFDLSQILATYGSLNYGGCSKYNEVLENYLAAETEDQKTTAAVDLCRTIYENSPIIPICYNKSAVAYPRFMIQGAYPSQQYLFWGLSNWTIHFNKED